MTRTTAVDLTLVVGIAACITTAVLGAVSGSWEVFRLGLVVVAIATGAAIAVAWAVALVTEPPMWAYRIAHSIRHRVERKDQR